MRLINLLFPQDPLRHKEEKRATKKTKRKQLAEETDQEDEVTRRWPTESEKEAEGRLQRKRRARWRPGETYGEEACKEED